MSSDDKKKIMKNYATCKEVIPVINYHHQQLYQTHGSVYQLKILPLHMLLNLLKEKKLTDESPRTKNSYTEAGLLRDCFINSLHAG